MVYYLVWLHNKQMKNPLDHVSLGNNIKAKAYGKVEREMEVVGYKGTKYTS